MAKNLRPVTTFMYALLAAPSLASCAAPVPPSAQLPQSPSIAGAQPDFGKVVSIRPLTFPTVQPTGIAGVSAVLTALGQETVEPPIAGEEILIQKDDGNLASLAQQSQSKTLEIGDRVVVTPGALVEDISRN